MDALLSSSTASSSSAVADFPLATRSSRSAARATSPFSLREHREALRFDILPVAGELRGTAGQSLGAWGMHGLVLDLEGQANDYVGKGLSGARIIVRPPANAGYDATSSIAVGNTTL